MEELIYEKAVFAPKGGKPGYIVNGKWYPVDPKDLKTPGFKQELERYGRTRGDDQLKKDQASLSKPSTPAATTQAPSTPSTTTPTPAGPTKPAIGTTAGGTKFERRAATGAELRAAQAARAAAKAAGDTKGAEEAAVKAGVEAGKSASKPAVTSRPSGFGVPTAPLAAKLSASTSPTGGTPPKLTPRQAKLNMEMEYDAYDIVLEHLLDEGYADTEESALAIMTNMSEEWRESIVEQDATSSMADRTRNAVANQRAGFHGDADALTRMQRTTQRSVNKATKPLKEV